MCLMLYVIIIGCMKMYDENVSESSIKSNQPPPESWWVSQSETDFVSQSTITGQHNIEALKYAQGQHLDEELFIKRTTMLLLY